MHVRFQEEVVRFVVPSSITIERVCFFIFFNLIFNAPIFLFIIKVQIINNYQILKDAKIYFDLQDPEAELRDHIKTIFLL